MLAVICAFALVQAAGGADSAPPKEYQLKAAYLLQFVRFVEWPASAFASDDAPVRIGVLGEDPFGAALDEMVRGETVRNRPVTVQRAQRSDDLVGCQLVYIGRSERERVGDELALLSGHAVLTVSDLDHFADHGGDIGFYPDGRKVRFEIAPANVQRHGLKISAKLLSLARIVDAGEGGK